MSVDEPAMHWLLALRTPELTGVLGTLTHAGDSVVLTGIVALGTLYLWGARGHWRAGTYLTLAGLGAGLLNSALKHVFARVRPELTLVDAAGYAFPSGHSMGSAAVYGALAVIALRSYPERRGTILGIALLVTLVVGFTRAYLFVHFPSDVLAGWAVGWSWAVWLRPVLARPQNPADALREELEVRDPTGHDD